MSAAGLLGRASDDRRYGRRYRGQLIINTIDEVAGVVLPLEADDPAMAGPYSLRRRLGAGGMGRVYLAYTEGGRAIAVKVMRPELADDPEFRLRFRREVAAAREVRGMFTAEVVDADPDANPPWLATAYVPGLSLAEAVRASGPLPEATVWRLLAGVAEALQAVHAAGIIHRDLKPTNVILAPDGPKVIDFGIARTRDVTQLTRTGVSVGSPQYMAPEHILGRELTDAVDVFSLGALGVFAISGRSPFGEGPDVAVLYRVVNEQPNLTGIDGELRELLASCLAKDPEQRPSLARILRTCQALGDPPSVEIDRSWLADPMDRETSQRTAETVPPTAIRTMPPRTKRRRAVYWLTGTAVVVSAALAAVWSLHGFGATTATHAPPPPSSSHPVTPTSTSTGQSPPSVSYAVAYHTQFTITSPKCRPPVDFPTGVVFDDDGVRNNLPVTEDTSNLDIFMGLCNRYMARDGDQLSFNGQAQIKPSTAASDPTTCATVAAGGTPGDLDYILYSKLTPGMDVCQITPRGKVVLLTLVQIDQNNNLTWNATVWNRSP